MFYLDSKELSLHWCSDRSTFFFTEQLSEKLEKNSPSSPKKCTQEKNGEENLQKHLIVARSGFFRSACKKNAIFYDNVFFSVLSLLVVIVCPTAWKSDIIADQDSGAILANGIIFNHVTKILLSEKFINVDFLVPFFKV